MDTSHWQKARQSRDPRFDGLFYVAVKSTGIYCRPICPAPTAHEKNVVYYQFAHNAAQDGFRPCIDADPIVPLAAQHGRVQKRLHLEQNS